MRTFWLPISSPITLSRGLSLTLSVVNSLIPTSVTPWKTRSAPTDFATLLSTFPNVSLLMRNVTGSFFHPSSAGRTFCAVAVEGGRICRGSPPLKSMAHSPHFNKDSLLFMDTFLYYRLNYSLRHYCIIASMISAWRLSTQYFSLNCLMRGSTRSMSLPPCM